MWRNGCEYSQSLEFGSYASLSVSSTMLVASLEQSYRSGSIDREHWWQYRGHPPSTDLTTALLSLLLLRTELAKSPKKKPALEKTNLA